MLTPEQARFSTSYQTPAPRPPVKQQLAPMPPTVPVLPSTDPSKQTSAVARSAVGLPQISAQAKAVLEVVCIAHRAGVSDLTGREVRAWWQKVHVGKDIDTSTLSPRIGELISAGLLERLPRRFCSITNIQAGPVRAVAQQTRLAK